MKNMVTKQFLITVLLIFALQVVILSYIYMSFYASSVNGIKSLGVSNMESQAAMIENYLHKGDNVMWLAAESVDFMLKKGESVEEISAYLTGATNEMQRRFDANFTGIYGVIRGKYVDGSGWQPPSDFFPKERNWYKEAANGGGRIIVSEPYIDAHTGDVVISYAKLLSDNESVLALDIVLGEVQKNTERMSIGGEGYGFIVNSRGLVVAHSDEKEKGKQYNVDKTWANVLPKIFMGNEREFEANINGETCTVFSEHIAEDWYVVIVVSNARLFHELRSEVAAGVLLMFLTFGAIVAFCAFSVKKIGAAEEKEHEVKIQLERTNANIIKALVSTIDAKDHYTSGHSQRVANYSVEIAKRMGKSEEEQQLIRDAGILHDIGKIRVPVEVINKKGRLNDEEFDQIRLHPVAGFLILKDIHEDERIAYAAKYHHERYDGRGYPNGIAGENIPEVARIVAVADAYDAMASNRSYRKALPKDVVRSEIEKGKGTQFDPVVADIMLAMIDEDEGYNMRQADENCRNILLIDEDKNGNENAQNMLGAEENIAVLCAESLNDALNILKDIRIDIVFVNLKEESWLGVIGENYKGPIILMTEDKSVAAVEKARRLNMSDYITKPLNHAITVETIRSVLN